MERNVEERLLTTCFIKAKEIFEKQSSEKEGAPMFRKRFYISKLGTAKVTVLALGVGVFYLNGKRMMPDLFVSPFSDYEKICYYNVYDVTALLVEGENVFSVICGNGFFNEAIETQFEFHNAPWRDNPKFRLRLEIDGELAVETDESWLVNENSFITYNQFRSGEIFDARKYQEDWTQISFDDSDWKHAVIDDKPPQGMLVKDACPPILEQEYLQPKSIKKNEKGYLVDFGKNIAGYCRLEFCGKEGDVIELRHAEEADYKDRLQLNFLDMLYPQTDFQTEKIICSGKPMSYTPYFVYFGFRYVQIIGVEDIADIKIKAIFVHQDIKRISSFYCGNEIINYIYNASDVSFYSNAMGTITDCPTREKLGWINDIQASAEQFLMNFDIECMFDRLLKEMRLEIGEDGSIPAIIPTCNGWGRHNGPVADGALFTIPCQLYKYKGTDKYLKECLPYFYKYMDYLHGRLKRGEHLLGDWLGFGCNHSTPERMIDFYYYIKFKEITALAEECSGNEQKAQCLQQEITQLKQEFCQEFIDKDGKCVIVSQTALALIISEKLTDNLQPIKEQFLREIKACSYQISCGMFGLQFIFEALREIGEDEIAYRMIVGTHPGYATWYRNGATSLWECWDGIGKYSHNHHMYSCTVNWFFKGLLGITQKEDSIGFTNIQLKPAFIKEIGYAEGSLKTVNGTIYAKWEIQDNVAKYQVDIPENITAEYNSQKLQPGQHIFEVKLK